MVVNLPFCTKCGNEISSEDDFCRKCGTPTTQTEDRVQTVKQTEVSAPSVESELFTIDGLKGMSKHLLVFTNQRLIVALVGGGKTRLLTGGGIRAVYEGRKIRKMKERDIADLMADEKSYTFPYTEINNIEVAKGGRIRSGSITIRLRVGKPEKYKVNIKKRFSGFERLLRPVLGDKLIVIR